MNFETIKEIWREQRTSLVGVGLLFFVNVAVMYYSAWFQSPALAKVQDEWNAMRAKLAVADRRNAAAIYRQGIDDLAQLKTRIPRKRDFPRVLGDIFEAAASSGVVTGAVTYKPQIIKDEKLLAYTVNLSVAGGYAAVKSFLADLQRNRELQVIDSIGLVNSDPYEENLTLTMQITVYLQEGGA